MHELFVKGRTKATPCTMRILAKVDIVVAMLRRGELTESGVIVQTKKIESLMTNKRLVLH